MIHWEPSDRKDRAIQRRKLRAMWRSLRAEKARLAMLPGRGRKQHPVTDYVDVTNEADKVLLIVIGAFALWGILLVMSV